MTHIQMLCGQITKKIITAYWTKKTKQKFKKKIGVKTICMHFSPNLFRCVTSPHCSTQQNVSQLQQSGCKAGHPEAALLLVAASSWAWGRLGWAHRQSRHGGEIAGCGAMGSSRRVGVAREPVMDGTGQWVQLLQWYSEFNPHVTGHQISAGQTAMATNLNNKKTGNSGLSKFNLVCLLVALMTNWDKTIVKTSY